MLRSVPPTPLLLALLSRTPPPIPQGNTAALARSRSPGELLRLGVFARFLPLAVLVRPAPAPAGLFPLPTKTGIHAHHRAPSSPLLVLGLHVPLSDIDGSTRQSRER